MAVRGSGYSLSDFRFLPYIILKDASEMDSQALQYVIELVQQSGHGSRLSSWSSEETWNVRAVVIGDWERVEEEEVESNCTER